MTQGICIIAAVPWCSVAIHNSRRSGDAQLLGDLVQALACAPETLNLLDDPLVQLRSAVALAAHPGFGNARAHAFRDERALELGNGRDDREHGFAHGGGGVDLLRDGNEVDSRNCIAGSWSSVETRA
jgi:hypothetical protein